MNQNPFLFFVKYYYKKHIGKYLFSQPVSAADLFWKRYFRTAKKINVSVEKILPTEIIVATNSVEDKKLQLYVRLDNGSDIKVFDQVFSYKEYQPLVELIKKHMPEKKIEFIIDAGTNVGYTSVVFKTIFPDAAIICIEPDDNNSKQIGKNFTLNNISNYNILKVGLWSKNGWLTLKNDRNNSEAWELYVTESATETSLQSMTLETILNNFNWPRIDVLKMDIEGSEHELFKDKEGIKQLLKKTRYLAIEIHDEFADRNEIYKILKEESFEWFETGELTIANNTLLR